MRSCRRAASWDVCSASLRSSSRFNRAPLALVATTAAGLIEGAHEDRGLGHEFLRHIERTHVLAYVVDASGSSGTPPPQQQQPGGGNEASDPPSSPKGAAALGGWDPAADLRALQRELFLYDPGLPARPSVVIANKMDLPGAQEGLAKLRVRRGRGCCCRCCRHAFIRPLPPLPSLQAATSLPVIPVSALQKSNVGAVANALRWLVDALQKAALAPPPPLLPAPAASQAAPAAEEEEEEEVGEEDTARAPSVAAAASSAADPEAGRAGGRARGAARRAARASSSAAVGGEQQH